MADKNSKSENGGKQEKVKPSVLEWMIAVVGLILVVTAFSFIVYQAIFSKDTPPDLTVEVESINPVSAGYLVKFRVSNAGNNTAAAVNVEGTLKQGETVAETGSTTISYVPSLSKREGGIIFEKNPQSYQMQIRANGYANP